MAGSNSNALQKGHLGFTDLQAHGHFSAVDRRWSFSLHKRFAKSIPRWTYMALEHGGNGIIWLLIAPLLWLAAPLSGPGRYLLANFFLGLWVDIALVGALKGVFRRSRPEYNVSGDFILVVAVDKFSFPSGHASRHVSLLFFLLACS